MLEKKSQLLQPAAAGSLQALLFYRHEYQVLSRIFRRGTNDDLDTKGESVPDNNNTINRETNRFKTMTNYWLSWISRDPISWHKMRRMKENGSGVAELMY